MRRLFLDTNVVLDLLLERPLFVEAATQLVAEREARGIELLVSSLSFTNIHYLMRRQQRTDQQALGALNNLASFVQIAPVGEAIIKQALASGRPDFEDAVQLYAALAAGADAIVTRDPAGFRSSPLLVLDPLAALASL